MTSLILQFIVTYIQRISNLLFAKVSHDQFSRKNSNYDLAKATAKDGRGSLAKNTQDKKNRWES